MDEAQWGPHELLDYVYANMSPDGEVGDKDVFILTHFMRRWTERAIPIAKFAFEVCGGHWHNAPVAPFMFQKGMDPYFAEEILRVMDR